MTTRNYIVLRSNTDRDGGVLGAGPSATDAEALELMNADMSRADHADARRDPRTLAIAEPMPLKLIAPLASDANPMQAGPTWGVEAVGATTSPFSGAGVTVAVLDTGIDADHPAFAGVELVRRNFTSEDDGDSNGHGTHCAGTIFGREVEGRRIGVAPGVERAVIGKVLGAGGGNSGQLSEAVLWAIREGANVVSMSLGIDFPGFVQRLVEENDFPVAPATSIALAQYRANVNLFNQVAAHVQALGPFAQASLVVAAAGNESERPAYEIAVAPPAAATGFVSVAALGRGDGGLVVAPFSNTEVDVSAPGVDVVSAATGGGLSSLSGTSMATPHVAGVTALWCEKLKAERDSLDAETLRAEVIASTTTDALAAGSETDDVGGGLVQAPA